MNDASAKVDAQPRQPVHPEGAAELPEQAQLPVPTLNPAVFVYDVLPPFGGHEAQGRVVGDRSLSLLVEPGVIA